ncbi:MAG: serine/threonine protein kinase, partial [Solirubrobacterales bacterium]|nr:serine/threonine protein kinase [Solirubrobacterales bacterium]
QHEARLAASIEHPNVLPVRDAGEEHGLLYITMRFVDGTDLLHVIDGAGRLEPPEAASITTQVGSALDAAHSHGLVHRDVKPGNVLIETTAEGQHAYLADFGLTKDMASQSGLTQTGMMVGTLDYVAPEQVRGGPVDARADVYALGCVLYKMLTGRIPFDRDQDVAKLWAHVNDPPPALDPTLGERYDEIIQRAMAKDPDARYPSAGDLGRAVEAASTGGVIAQPERSVATGEAAPGGAGERPPVRPDRAASRKRIALGAAIAALLGLAIVAAVVLASSGSSRSSNSQQAALRSAIAQLNRIPKAAALSSSLNATGTQVANVLNGNANVADVEPAVASEMATSQQLAASSAPASSSRSGAASAASRSAAASAAAAGSNANLAPAIQALLGAARALQAAVNAIKAGHLGGQLPGSQAALQASQGQLKKVRALVNSFHRNQALALSGIRSATTALRGELTRLGLVRRAAQQQLVAADTKLAALQRSEATVANALLSAVSKKATAIAAALSALTQAATSQATTSSQPATTPSTTSTPTTHSTTTPSTPTTHSTTTRAKAVGRNPAPKCPDPVPGCP